MLRFCILQVGALSLLMIDRINNRNNGLHLDYYTSKHPVRRCDKVNNWDEVLELMKEQL